MSPEPVRPRNWCPRNSGEKVGQNFKLKLLGFSNAKIVYFYIIVVLSSFAKASHSSNADIQQKLALAKQYLNVTHRDERVDDVYRRQMEMTWNGCEDAPCRTKLNQAISKAMAEAVPQYEDAYAHLIASRLTVNELQAAISFAQSPGGKAIVTAEIAMDGDIAMINHAFGKQVHDIVQKDFCSIEPKACAQIMQNSADPRSHR